MSLSRVKSITGEEDNYRRDSFGDRICDDLCEVILQYLSLEDKLRLECVSKQFQRTIFLKHRFLSLTHTSNLIRNNLAHILKKFSIKEIEFIPYLPRCVYHRKNYHNVIEPIIKYCDNSTKISIGFLDVMEIDQRQLFIEMFGANLVSVVPVLSVSNGHVFTEIFSQRECNIEILVLNSLIPELNKIQFTKLSKLEIHRLTDEDMDQLELFTEGNAKTIKFLTIKCSQNSDKKQFKHLLKIISKLRKLIHLSIQYSNYGLNDSSFDSEMKQMVINCKELKSIECNLLMDENMKSDELLSPLKQFKRLERLRLNFFHNFTLKDSELKQIFELSFKSLKDMNITHLTIYFPKEPINETILTDIDRNLPKLQFLDLNFHLEATNWTASTLQRLPNLETIHLILDSPIIPLMKNLLVQNCKKIKRVILYHSIKVQHCAQFCNPCEMGTEASWPPPPPPPPAAPPLP